MQRRKMSMPNRISTVATASLASALILPLLEGRGSAAPKLTQEECGISHKVCIKGCTGPVFDLGPKCINACDVDLANCLGKAPQKKAKPNQDAKPKKGIDPTQPPLKWVPNSRAKGKGVPSVPNGGTWTPSPSSGAKAPTFRSSGGRR
jgi:hypothetical protein